MAVWPALLLACAVGAATGCGGSGSGHGPGTLMIAAGDQQQGAAGTALAKPLQVRVVAKDGTDVVPGVTVQFSTVEGRGAFQDAFAVSDEKGIASAHYTLGKLPVRNRVSAAITGSSVTFEAHALNTHPPVPTERLTKLPLPGGLAFDNARHLLIASQLNGSLVRASPSPSRLSQEFVFDYLYRGKINSALTGVAVDEAGNVFACDSRTGALLEFGGSDTPDIFVDGYQFQPFSTPDAIAIHPHTHEILFSDTAQSRIYAVTPSGKPVRVFTEAVSLPTGLAFDTSGDTLYVASQNQGAVLAVPYGHDGGAGKPSKLDSVPTPEGVAIDADGNVYVAGTNGKKNGLYVIPADGSGTFLYFGAASPKAYTNVAFGRAGFNTSSIYLVSADGSLDEVDVGVPGLVLPGPPA